jgi:flagellin-like hook-associated protein FlgL
MFSLLNTRAGDRYLFSGRASDGPAIETTDHILGGDGARAGFRQVVAERLQADLGADGLGRLTVGSSGSQVSIAEAAAGSPFGFKIAGIATTIDGAQIDGPAGAPPAESISLADSSPSEGQTVTLQLTLPDGSSTTLTLTATTSAPPGPNQFSIGDSDATTADNLAAAVKGALTTLGKTTLTPASAMAAAKNFFDADGTHPPQRVAGPPFDTATALRDATASDTVTWYTGEAGADAARATATAKVDPSMSVAYGMRASEPAFRNMVEAMAVFATTTFSPSDPNGSETYAALTQRVAGALAGAPGQQQVSDIQAELGGAQATLKAAKDRHTQSAATLEDMLQGITGISPEEVGAKILALQTNLQATLQTTAMMYQTTILNYL